MPQKSKNIRGGIEGVSGGSYLGRFQRLILIRDAHWVDPKLQTTWALFDINKMGND